MVPNGELRVADGISIGVSINGMFPEEFVAVDFPITDNERHATVLDIVMIRTAGRFENPPGSVPTSPAPSSRGGTTGRSRTGPMVGWTVS